MHLSIIVCAYNIERELPRTIYTMSPAYQQGINAGEYEVIVLDNGSDEPVDEGFLKSISKNVKVVRRSPACPSPASAINECMGLAKSELVGLFIDGARMASPGLLSLAQEAYSHDPSKVIGSVAFHLGPDVQMRSVTEGYNQGVENELLASVPWQDDGYLLFGISVLAGSSAEGWFGCIGESNGVFLSRKVWNHLGGLDERFVSPGGGCVNLDFWERAVSISNGNPWILLGEGTFHQVHGGVATNGTADDRKKMFDEYSRLHGRDFKLPRYTPRLIGTLRDKLAADTPEI